MPDRGATKARPPGWLAAAGRVLPGVVAAALFAVLVTANSAGYRYGASDHAFYIPAVQDEVAPALFPEDSALIEAQGRLSVSDEVLAAVIRATGVHMEWLFLAGYLASALLFATAVLLVGTSLYHSAWTTAALLLALTLRHKVMGTGVNTFEGYFHPRVLAFALGLLAVAALLRGRRLAAAGLVGVTLVAHPTTGAWFALWLTVATLVERRGVGVLRPLVVAGTVALALAAAGELAGLWLVMDSAWLAVLTSKPYLFPTTWEPGTWIVNALAPVLLVALYRMRLARGLVSPAERGLFIGCGALILLFLASLPFIAERVALVVQLQTSRVLWQVELLATVYLVWALVEWPIGRPSRPARWRAPALVALLAACSIGRGVYILTVQFDRPLVEVSLPPGDWTEMARWAADHTPPDAQFLVHPEHAPMYGTSFRVGAARDVFVEAAKDSAIATYSRPIALRVRERLAGVPNFDSLTPAEVHRLAYRYDLEYLISERSLPFTEVHRVGRFRAYALPQAAP
jgi:hypothetical protein